MVGKKGTIAWDWSLIRQLSEITGKNQHVIQKLVRELSEALKIDLPKHGD